MFVRKNLFWPVGRAAGLAAVAVLTLTAAGPSFAGPARSDESQSAATSGATDFSARRRQNYHGGGAAAAAAFAGVVGMGLAIAAAESRRSYYEDYYDGGPVYYGGGPYYYGSGPHYYGGWGSGVPYYRGHPLAGW